MTRTNGDTSQHQPDKDKPLNPADHDDLRIIEETVEQITGAEVDNYLHSVLAQAGYCSARQHQAQRTRELAIPFAVVGSQALAVASGGSGQAGSGDWSAGTLFDGTPEIGYRGPTACAAAGITYRQLDYWARTGLVEPSVRAAHGSGSQRLYGFRDILVLKVVKRLLDSGISLQQIRAAVQHLHDHGTDDLAEVTLMSDGVTVYECTSANEVYDLLAGGQGVFGIALGRVWQEVAGELADLPAVRADDELSTSERADELAVRRAARKAD
jgi:DNA-binding transcriptional MerR regulator